jgi:SAM-dependent MidA family methyltransferase
VKGRDVLAEITTRVEDGIALGGDYGALFDRYVEAHNDRRYLLELFKKASDDASRRQYPDTTGS